MPSSCSVWRIAAIVGCVFLKSTGSLSAQELSESVLTKVRSATVEVHFHGQLRGGGVFVKSSDGKEFVLTAAHLFPSPKDTCTVVASDDEVLFATLTAYDLGHDLALLEVGPEASKYGALKIASKTPQETEPIFNFGPALRRRTLVLSGNVADSRTCYTDFSASEGYIEHYFAGGINPVLTSGGTWVNRKGEIVGVQHGRLIGDEGAPSSGLSMVSPPAAISNLIEKRAVASTPSIGGYVWEVWTADRQLLSRLPKGIHGVVASPIFKGRPLDKAGIKNSDVIVSCDGSKIRRRHELLEAIRSKPPGTTFTLEVISPGSGKRRTVYLTTDTLEALWQ